MKEKRKEISIGKIFLQNTKNYCSPFFNHVFFCRGLEQTNTHESRKCLLDDCVKMISSNLVNARDKEIPIDCDALSFVVVADAINEKYDQTQKQAIAKFLYHFGTKWSAVSSSPIAMGAGKRSSVFGCSRNKCQHLTSSKIGTLLESSEVQVITTPVKLAIHKSCKDKLVNHVCAAGYPIQMATNKDICFNPSSNKPPYGVIVDAILNSSLVPNINKFVIHIADIGTRHKILCEDDGDCCLQQMFNKVQTMRAVGVHVELTQIDIAFNIKTMDGLVQWSYRKGNGNICQSLESATAEVWPLHTINVTNNGQVSPDRDQEGTIRLQQQKWEKPKVICMFSDSGRSNDSDDDDVQLPLNNTLRKILYPSQSWMDAKSIHHIKCYSSVAHALKQGQRLVPLTYSKMKDVHQMPFSSLNNLWDHMRKISGETINLVKCHGIFARMEVSLRPGSHRYGDILRCKGHLIDVLAHVQIAIHDLFCGRHKLSFKTIPYELVYPKTLSLISQAESQTRIRASRRFCDFFKGEKYEEWLKAFVSLIMITAGLTGEIKSKSVAKWLHDSKRHDPTNQATIIQTNFLFLDNSDHPITRAQEIPHKHLRKLAKLLIDLKFTKISRDCIFDFLKSEWSNRPSSHSRMWYQKLSLKDKLRLAQYIHTSVIPNLCTVLCKKRDNESKDTSTKQRLRLGTKPQENSPIVDIADDSWDDRHLVQYTLYHQKDPLLHISPMIMSSALALNQFQEHTVGNSYRKWCSLPPKDPTILLVMRLLDLARFTDVQMPVFTMRLYHYIQMCHEEEIRLPRQRENLKKLDCDNRSQLAFCNASICLRDHCTDVNSLHTICTGLGVKILGCGTRHGELLLASLSYWYYFPCSSEYSGLHPLDECVLEEDLLQPLNELLDTTLQKEFVSKLPCFTNRMNHFYRQSDNQHMYITKKEFITSTAPCDATAATTTESAYDIHIVIDKCLNYQGTWGEDSRRNITEFLCEKNCLCDNFLLDNATNNPDFSNAQTLRELEFRKHFVLVDRWDALDENYRNMCPEVIMPITSLLHQCNTFFIDKDKEETQLHIFDKKSSKVITYFFPNTKTSPSVKCHVFWKEDGLYKYTSFIQRQAAIPPNSNLFWGKAKNVNAFKKHPQGEPLHAKTLVDSLQKLLMTNEINHEHFRSQHKENDVLDIHSFLGELSASLSDSKHLNDLFSANIVLKMNKEGIFSLNDLLSNVKKEKNTLLHAVLCPILCLKYKLWICVWEDDCGNKNSYFYGFEPIKGSVVCEERLGYTHLEEQSHILYIKSSKTNRGSRGGFNFGYWRQVVYNPYTHPHTTYNFSEILRCKFSYLDGTLEGKVTDLFKRFVNMKIMTKEFCKHPIVKNGNYPAIIPIEILQNERDLVQHAVFVCYPFDHATRIYNGCLVHTELSSNEVKETLKDIMDHVGMEHIAEYKLRAVSVHHKSDFASSFFAKLHMYIANKSTNIEEFQESLMKLNTVNDIVNKTKAWIADVLGSVDVEAVSRPPQWLYQLIGNKNNIQQPISTDTKVSDRNMNTRKRSMSLMSFDGLSSNRKKRSIRMTKQDRLIKYITTLWGNTHIERNGFEKFISIVKDKCKSITGKTQEKNDYVAQLTLTGRRFPMQPKSLATLFGTHWLNDEVINYVGAILDTQNDTARVFSTFFFTKLRSDYNKVLRWWKKVSPSVRHVYIPINIDNLHWIFLRMDFELKRIQLWDSLGQGVANQKYLSTAETYVRDVRKVLPKDKNHIHLQKMWGGKWTSHDESICSPKQTNGYDCGLFIILSMAIMIQGGHLTTSSYSQQDIYNVKIRDLILQLIYQCKD